MRLFILSLLAVSTVHASTIGYPYRSELLSYSPARGEFPVQSTLAQGYIRYLDEDGSERLVGFKYPEPLYGIQQVIYGGEDIKQKQLLASNLKQIAKAREEHFRAWSQNRYQVLKAEADRLRFAGRSLSSDMKNQLEALELIVNAPTFDEVIRTPAVLRLREEHLRVWNETCLKVLQLDPEYLQLQMPLKPQPILYSIDGTQSQLASAGGSYAPIGETAEQKKAREDHLRIYNEQILRVQQLEAERLREQNIKSASGSLITSNENKETLQQSISTSGKIDSSLQSQYQQSPVEETPEVKRAREEHLKLVNEAILKASQTYNADKTKIELNTPEVVKAVPGEQQTAIQQPIPSFKAGYESPKESNDGIDIKSANQEISASYTGQVQYTPEVVRAREEHLKLFNEAKLRAEQYKSQSQSETHIQSQSQNGQLNQDKAITYTAIDSNDNIQEAERKREEERIREAERQREAEYIREEERMREEERLREAQRQKEEQLMLETERIRLQQEEERRMAKEKLEEAQYLKTNENVEGQGQSNTYKQSESTSQQISGHIKSEIQTGAAAVQNQAFVLAEQYKNNPYFLRLAAVQPNAGVAPATSTYLIGQQKPALSGSLYYYIPSGISSAGNANLRYIQNGRKDSVQDELVATETSSAAQVQQNDKLNQYLSDKFTSYTGSSNSASIQSSEAAALSELEKATRNHFRAHEIALEQLRLAN